jgi:hypothetical protein
VAKNVTAYVLSENVGVGADGATIPGVPGLWFHDRPVLPAALGYTVETMDEAIEILGLPISKVSVPEKQAYDFFPSPPNQLESAREVPGVPGVFGSAPVADAPEVEQVLATEPGVLDDTLDKAQQIEEQEQVSNDA